MLKKISLMFLTLIFLFLTLSPIQAQSEFTTDYQVDYTINQSGLTHAKYQINLINQLSNVYATEFSITVSSTRISNITAYTDNHSLEPQITNTEQSTIIKIPFKDKVVGEKKENIFYLEFDSQDFANQLGSVWEVTIPRIANIENINSYTLNLYIPTNFGQPNTFTPQPISSSVSNKYHLYRFSQQDLLNQGIIATFGNTQYFDFSLNYFIQNQKVTKIKTEIALPPDLPLQKVILNTLEPTPDTVIVDQDGNWLAQYTLLPRQSLNITAAGSAEIYLQPQPDFPVMPLTDKSAYLSEQKFWEVNNPRIQQTAQNLNSAYDIYQYVVNNLIYDHGRLGENSTRFGAANALDNPDSAVCMEYTDLFIALSRAKQIPARFVSGFAYTTNESLRPLSLKQDVLHAWPEYYNQNEQRWIPIDPTWGDTTGNIDFFHQFDLNHFTFTLQGLDSNYPVPAGAYKNPLNPTKDVQVEFGSQTTQNQSLSINIKLPQTALAGTPLQGQILIKNTGNTAVYYPTVYLQTQSLNLDKTEWQLPILPPFASYSIDLSIPATDLNTNLIEVLTVSTNLASQSHQLTIKPAYQYLLTPQIFWPLLLMILLIILIIILILILKSRKKSVKIN